MIRTKILIVSLIVISMLIPVVIAFTYTRTATDTFTFQESINSILPIKIRLSDSITFAEIVTVSAQQIYTTVMQTVTQTLNTILCGTGCSKYTADTLSFILTEFAYPIIIIVIVLILGVKFGMAGSGVSFMVALITILLMANYGLMEAWVVLLTIVGLSGALAYSVRRFLNEG